MNFISLMLFCATCLITNSHFDPLYPSALSFLSTGGMIGNGLFFFVSGYTLFSSVQRSARSRNSTIYWFARRILRIYPTYWIYLIVSQCLESNGGGGDFDYRFVRYAILVPQYDNYLLRSLFYCSQVPRYKPYLRSHRNRVDTVVGLL